jgi:WhiB family transcriptional regulator, redox-sensing transcriptional regulator
MATVKTSEAPEAVFPWQPVAWQAEAVCAELPEDEADALFFPRRGESTKAARALCSGCPVRADCLEYAIANREQFGIWGGTSERERRKLRRTTAA